MKPDFDKMSKSQLRAYVLSHRDDEEAFYKLADRLESSSDDTPLYPCPDTPEAIAIMKQAIADYVIKSSILGQTYFETRLGDIYKYSIIQYKCGQGSSDQGTKYYWELCVDVSGNIIFVLHQYGFNLDSFKKTFNIQSFSGTSDDQMWDITCSNISILLKQAEQSGSVTHFCLPSAVVLTHKDKKDSALTLAKAYLSNFYFERPDFVVNINGKNINFKMLDNSQRFLDFIDMNRINNVVFSTVSIPINEMDNIDDINQEIESISWFLSFIKINGNFSPVIEYFVDDKIVQYNLENTTKKSFKKNSYIFDNFNIDEGIPKAFEKCYESYKIWNEKIDFNTLIGYLREIEQQNIVDLKLATMIMAYEYILLKYLLSQGLTHDKIGENIQQKLRQVNKYLKFIPNNMMDDTLRNTVRNPLFHQGAIPLLSQDDKIDFFKKYYDFLIQITLKFLGYSGKYISITGDVKTL